MNEPILVVMAAGMGSRYGGLKQMDPMGSNGELILDFSLYDAYRAGFRRVVFVIKREMEKEFRALMDGRAAKKMEISYAFQELTDLPEGFDAPVGRAKPWGTGHAVLAARKFVDAPFAVINADDYYGVSGFDSIYQFLKNAVDGEKYCYCMVGYQVENTLTENGSVARGICGTSEDGYLVDIVERTKIFWEDGRILFTEEESVFSEVPVGTPVSMNLWGFTPGMMDELAAGFPVFLTDTLKNNPMKGEYFLPSVVDRLIKEGKAAVKVLHSPDRWYGVTYQEDKRQVVEALQKMKDSGLYPQKLWEEVIKRNERSGLMGFLDDLGEKAKKGLDIAGEKTNELVGTAKLKYEISGINSDLGKVYEKLGRLMYEEEKSNDPQPEQKEALISEIDRLKKNLLDAQQRMQEVK